MLVRVYGVIKGVKVNYVPTLNPKYHSFHFLKLDVFVNEILVPINCRPVEEHNLVHRRIDFM